MNSEKYKKLKKEIYDYEQDILKNNLVKHICVSCKTNLIDVVFPEHDISYDDATNQDNMMHLNGGVGTISFGYGSLHDMQTYYVALCDKCVDDLENLKILHNKYRIKQDIKKEII